MSEDASQAQGATGQGRVVRMDSARGCLAWFALIKGRESFVAC